MSVRQLLEALSTICRFAKSWGTALNIKSKLTGIRLHDLGKEMVFDALAKEAAVTRKRNMLQFRGKNLYVLTSNRKTDIEPRVGNWGWELRDKPCDYYICVGLDDAANPTIVYVIEKAKRSLFPSGVGRFAGKPHVFAITDSAPNDERAKQMVIDCKELIHAKTAIEKSIGLLAKCF